MSKLSTSVSVKKLKFWRSKIGNLVFLVIYPIILILVKCRRQIVADLNVFRFGLLFPSFPSILRKILPRPAINSLRKIVSLFHSSFSVFILSVFVLSNYCNNVIVYILYKFYVTFNNTPLSYYVKGSCVFYWAKYFFIVNQT